MVETGRNSTRRNLVAATVVAAVLGIVAAGAAFACTALASLSVSPDRGPAGTPITITGTGFVPSAAVSFRWGGASGPLLAQEFADETGRAAASATVPADAPAEAVVINAFQKTTNSQGEEVVRTNSVVYTVTTGAAEQAPAQQVPVTQPPAAQVAQAPAPAVQQTQVTQAAPAASTAPPASAAPAAPRQPATRTTPQVATAAPQPAPAPAPQAAPVPSAPAPAPTAAVPAETPQVRVAEPNPGGRVVPVERSSSSSESGTPGWLAPAILLGVVLAVASCAVVAGGTPRRRVRSASVVATPNDDRGSDTGPLHSDSSS